MKQMLFRMFDLASDPASFIPGVDVGAVHFWLWSTLNPARGDYNWKPIEDALAVEAKWKLSDGSVKPSIEQVLPYISSASGWVYGFYDATPGWVYEGIPHDSLGGRSVGRVVTDKAGNKACVPGYDQEAWRNAWAQFVQAFGDYFDGDKRIAYVVATCGLDGETQATKGSWLDAIRGTALERGFGLQVDSTITAYAAAFVYTPVVLNCAPGGAARTVWANRAMGAGLGLKHSGAQPDQDSHWGYGNYPGSWTMIVEAHEREVPVAIETAHWFGKEESYWTLPAILHYQPTWVDLHSSLFDSCEPEWLQWMVRYVGTTPRTSPGVWTVLRDMEYPEQYWGEGKADGCSGKPGDWQFGLTRLDPMERVMKAALPAGKDNVRARQCRKISDDDGAVRFQVDSDYQARYLTFRVEVTYLDYGRSSFSVRTQLGRPSEQFMEVITQDTGTWKTVSLGGFSIGDDGIVAIEVGTYPKVYVHKVEVIGTTSASHSPSPSPSPSEEGLEARVTELERAFESQDDEIAEMERQLDALKKQCADYQSWMAQFVEVDLTVLAKRNE